MLLPETEIAMARERIQELLRQDQYYKSMITTQRSAAKREGTRTSGQRNWFKLLLSGKFGV